MLSGVGVLLGVDMLIVAVCTSSSPLHAKIARNKLQEPNTAAHRRSTRHEIKLT